MAALMMKARTLIFLLVFIVLQISKKQHNRAYHNSLFRPRSERSNSRKVMDMDVTGKRRRGRPRLRWTDNNREDMTKYELTADMTENRQYWKMMVKTGPRRCGDGL